MRNRPAPSATGSRSHTNSKLRIIGGRWRRRNLEFLNLPGIRPTPNRVRETLFNWIALDIEGAKCLDLFAGSGALGFEALSRGAAAATLIEIEPRVCAQLESEITRFGATGVEVITADAHTFLKQASGAYDIIFIDPPFGAGLAQEALALIALNSRILSPASLIYVEQETDANITPPTGFSVLRQKQTPEVLYALLGVRSNQRRY